MRFTFKPGVTPRRRRGRSPGAAPAPPPAPPLLVSFVGVDHGTEFDYSIYWEFGGALPAGLSLADLAPLRVDGVGPAAVEDAGPDWLMLRFHSDQGVGAEWLVLPAGPGPIFLPGQAGVVGEI